MKSGKVCVYFGQGKGKTTISIGYGIEALEDGKTVVIVQFLHYGKKRNYSLLKKFEPKLRIFSFEKDNTSKEEKEIKYEVFTAINFVKKIFETGESDVIILDGALDAVSKGFITDDELCSIIEKHSKTDVIITGEGITEKISKFSDEIYNISEYV